jgi:hypothetical protein
MATPTTLPSTFVAGSVLTAAEMNALRGAFRILQVVSTTKSDTFSSSLAAGASTAVTGLSASITPSSTDSKILVAVTLNGASANYAVVSFITKRDGTAIGVGDTAGSRSSVSGSSMAWAADTRAVITASSEYLDSPASTSALTYSVDVINVSGATRTIYVNRSGDDTNAAGYSRAISTITLLEVSA